MTILFVGSSPDALGGATIPYTGANGRDSDFTPVASQVSYPRAGAGFVVNVDDAAGDVWLHFIVYTSDKFVSGNNNDDGYWMNIYNDDTLLFRFNMSNGELSFRAGDGSSSNIVAMANNTEYTVDIHFAKAAGTHTAKLYFGGTLQATSTYDNAAGVPNRFSFDHVDISSVEIDDIGTAFYSEFIVTDDESTIGWRLATLEPAADGTYTAWDGDYTGLDVNGDGLSISSDTGEAKQSWDLSAYGGPATASGVRAVVTSFMASAGISGPDQIVPFVRSGGTDYEGTAITPVGTQELYVLDNNPDGDATWDTADLSSIEIGVKAKVS